MSIKSKEYEINGNEGYQQTNRAAWHNFVAGGKTKPPADEVYQGWLRCKKMQVDPYQKTAQISIGTEELEELRKINRTFLRTSRPVMESLYAFLSDDNFVVALSNAEGILLEVFGDVDLQSSVKKGNWLAGADWSEAKAGNNIIGTPIYLDKPVMIIGYEHYCRCSHHHAGAGAPIHDKNGEIIGAISIAGTFEKVHPHTLGMIVAAQRAIETQMEMRLAWKSADRAKNQLETIISTVSEGIMVADANDRITFCNTNAAIILNSDVQNFIGKPLGDFLSEPSLKRFHNIEKGSLDDETVFKVGDNYVKCISSFRHIIKKGLYQGMVLALTAYSRAERLANKFSNKDTYWSFDNLVGESTSIQQMMRAARRAASTDSSILLLGESGTGKDVFAQAIHNASARRSGPYVAVNCAALPKELINSELFGYTEGAFTGAKKGGSEGKVELANGGTLFLDEIGEMPVEQQTILLRLLENHTIQKIGSGKEARVDIRVIAATNRNLLEEVNQHRFRSDLYYRLNVFTISIPPLRDRKDDIPALVDSFLDRLSSRTGQPKKQIDTQVMDSLIVCDWPGNIRELQNVLERAWMLSDGSVIYPDVLPLLGLEASVDRPVRKMGQPMQTSIDTRQLTAQDLETVLVKNNWNISKSCLELGISRPTMYRKLSQFGLSKGR